MTVGERIKITRESFGYSQVDLADKIGVSKQSLYKYENNIITNIPSDKIELIAEIVNVTPAYLMGWESKPITQSVAPAQLSAADQRLLNYYHLLNLDGQRKLYERAEELLELGYTSKGAEKIG